MTCELLNKHNFVLTDKITGHIPTIREVRGESFLNGSDSDEEAYYSIVQMFSATATDMIVELHDSGVPLEEFKKITDFQVFLWTFQSMDKEKLSKYSKLLFDDLDLGKFDVVVETSTQKPCLRNEEDDMVIKEMLYMQMSSFFCAVTGIEKNKTKPANDIAYDYKVERIKTKAKNHRVSSKKYTSRFNNQILALVNNSNFKYDFNTVQELTIYDFTYSVKQILRKYTADNLNRGVYAGTVKYKDVEKSLDWIN